MSLRDSNGGSRRSCHDLSNLASLSVYANKSCYRVASYLPRELRRRRSLSLYTPDYFLVARRRCWALLLKVFESTPIEWISLYSLPFRGRSIVDIRCLLRLCHNETRLLSTQAIIGHFGHHLHLAWLYGSSFGRPMAYEEHHRRLPNAEVMAIEMRAV